MVYIVSRFDIPVKLQADPNIMLDIVLCLIRMQYAQRFERRIPILSQVQGQGKSYSVEPLVKSHSRLQDPVQETFYIIRCVSDSGQYTHTIS
jgi:hypothetical protein